jgi:hypothetical protein
MKTKLSQQNLKRKPWYSSPSILLVFLPFLWPLSKLELVEVVELLH